jgi:hypothetical protein
MRSRQLLFSAGRDDGTGDLIVLEGEDIGDFFKHGLSMQWRRSLANLRYHLILHWKRRLANPRTDLQRRLANPRTDDVSLLHISFNSTLESLPLQLALSH